MPPKRTADAAPEGPARQSTRPRRAADYSEDAEDVPEEQDEQDDSEPQQVVLPAPVRKQGPTPGAKPSARNKKPAAEVEEEVEEEVLKPENELSSTGKYLEAIAALKRDSVVRSLPPPPPSLVLIVGQELDPSAITAESNIRPVRPSGVAFLVKELSNKGWQAVCLSVVCPSPLSPL